MQAKHFIQMKLAKRLISYCSLVTGQVVQSAAPEKEENEVGFASEDEESDGGSEVATEADMEDLAGPFSKQKVNQIPAVTAPGQPKPMLTPVLRASLGKQGYKLIGEPFSTWLLWR